jgi:hypothetical protein
MRRWAVVVFAAAAVVLVSGAWSSEVSADETCERVGVRCVHPGVHRHLWLVTGEAVVLQVGAVYALSQLPPETTQWGQGSVGNIWDNAQGGLRFDTDAWYWNYVGHPLAGSEYYLLARNRGLGWATSLLYAFAMSAFWELVTEGFYERTSAQDLFITPIGGAVLGELRWQIAQALIDPRTGAPRSALATVLLILVDPFDAIFRALDWVGSS